MAKLRKHQFATGAKCGVCGQRANAIYALTQTDAALGRGLCESCQTQQAYQQELAARELEAANSLLDQEPKEEASVGTIVADDRVEDGLAAKEPGDPWSNDAPGRGDRGSSQGPGARAGKSRRGSRRADLA